MNPELSTSLLADSSSPALSNQLILQQQIENLERELLQAKSIWHSVLSSERREWRGLLDEKESRWKNQEIAWQKEREQFAQRLQLLETTFLSQLKEIERNSIHALNELDSAWRQERSAQPVADAPAPEADLASESRAQLEATLAALHHQVVGLRDHLSTLLS